MNWHLFFALLVWFAGGVASAMYHRPGTPLSILMTAAVGPSSAMILLKGYPPHSVQPWMFFLFMGIGFSTYMLGTAVGNWLYGYFLRLKRWYEDFKDRVKRPPFRY